MPSLAYADAPSEYWYNVTAQRDMPLAGTVDIAFDVPGVATFLRRIAATPDAVSAQRLVADDLELAPALLGSVRQLLGISDKRAYLELSYLASRRPHPTASTGLCGCQPWTMGRHAMSFFSGMLKPQKPPAIRRAAAELIADYLIGEGLLGLAESLSSVEPTVLGTFYSVAIARRENQQPEAKLRGHGCEATLAAFLLELGAAIVPPDRASNPMGSPDPNLRRDTFVVAPRVPRETFSFDLLIMDGATIRVVVQSLIHTSDPGQYGVSKSDETITIRRALAERNAAGPPDQAIELWGLLDGVGFSENKEDTLNKMLGAFGTFVQLATLYKAGLRLHALGLVKLAAIVFDSSYTDDDVAAITQKYVPHDVTVLPAGSSSPTGRLVRAGRASLWLS